MTHKVIILPSAENDLRSIGIRLDEYSLTAFDRLMQEIEKRFLTLSQFPEIGRSCEAFSQGLRVIFVKDHALFYRFTPSTVEIVRIVDGRRDLSTLWDEPS